MRYRLRRPPSDPPPAVPACPGRCVCQPRHRCACQLLGGNRRAVHIQRVPSGRRSAGRRPGARRTPRPPRSRSPGRSGSPSRASWTGRPRSQARPAQLLERRRNGARVGDVVAEVRAVVDAGDDQLRLEPIRPRVANRTQSTGVPSVAKPVVPSPNSTSSTHSGGRVVMLRALADRFASGAITASSTPGTPAARAAAREGLAWTAVVREDLHLGADGC